MRTKWRWDQRGRRYAGPGDPTVYRYPKPTSRWYDGTPLFRATEQDRFSQQQRFYDLAHPRYGDVFYW